MLFRFIIAFLDRKAGLVLFLHKTLQHRAVLLICEALSIANVSTCIMYAPKISNLNIDVTLY